MEPVFLSLGSNQGQRRFFLEAAIAALKKVPNFAVHRLSSTYETPALLPPEAPTEWNMPYWNLIVEGRATEALTPHGLLAATQQIEQQLGRNLQAPRWSPRPIDIDVLLFGRQTYQGPPLSLPHPAIHQRSFVLDPLAELIPQQVLDQVPQWPFGRTVLDQARSLPTHQPQWMGILNATPDSFSSAPACILGSDETLSTLEDLLCSWDFFPLAWIDLGGESTRPNAQAVSEEEEWKRLVGPLQVIQHFYQGRFIRPKISIDTRHPGVAAKALAQGVDAINDVTGVSDLRMQEVLRESHCQVCWMHSLSVPVKPGEYLPSVPHPSQQIFTWALSRAEVLEKAGIARDRWILDPGIGFGKNALQNQKLLKNIKSLHSLQIPLLVGASRKSFMATFSPYASYERDLETLGVSFSLGLQGVEILRVHRPEQHHRAFLSFAHVSP